MRELVALSKAFGGTPADHAAVRDPYLAACLNRAALEVYHAMLDEAPADAPTASSPGRRTGGGQIDTATGMITGTIPWIGPRKGPPIPTKTG